MPGGPFVRRIHGTQGTSVGIGWIVTQVRGLRRPGTSARDGVAGRFHNGRMRIERHPRAVPSGYPRSFERRLRLHDGREVDVRPIVPADTAALREAIRTADADTLRGRFLGGSPSLTPAMMTHLTTMDYGRRFSLVAMDARTGHGAGIARYETMDEGVAEVAVAVDPAWRQVGLATALVEILAEAALDRQVHTFSAIYQAENRPVAALRGLAQSTGRQLIRHGVAEFAVTLDRDRVIAAIRHLGARSEG
jgi:GNAT superfamily N-acetyltransferase